MSTEGAERRAGMTRREMIRAAAAAGVTAWTAPIIIDSLASPAAAASVCIKYYAKLDDHGDCVAHDPSCSYAVQAKTKYVCCSSDTTGEDCPYPAKLPTFVTYATNKDYYQVTLVKGCYFPSPPKAGTENNSNWQVVGNYDFNCVRLEGNTLAAPSSTYTGNGYFTIGGRTAWIKNKHTFASPVGSKDFTYVYLQFCCGD